MQSALDPQNFPEHMIEERNVDDDIQIISYRPLASESGSQGGSLSRSSSLSTALDRALQPEEPQFSKDATKQCDWFHSAKENSAAKFLHRIWFQLQVGPKTFKAVTWRERCICFATSEMRNFPSQIGQGNTVQKSAHE